MDSLAYSVVNFSILVGILTYKLRQPIKSFVAERYVTVKNEIHTASEELRIAQAKYSEFTSKLRTVNDEILALRKQSEADSKALREKVLSEAKELSKLIQEDARKAASGMQTEVKAQLLLELSSKVFERAEILIKQKLSEVNHDAIRKEFSNLLETAK